MAEDTEREEAETDAAGDDGGSGDGAASAVSGVTERVRGAFDGDEGLPKSVLIPAGVAAVAALGYAATKAAPKIKDSLTTKAADEAEELSEGALGKAEQKGGVTGFAAKLFKQSSDGGDGGDGGGLLGGVTSKIPGLGGGKKEPSKGWGKGRRNPIQRYCDVGVPVETAYNQWTQFEEFPKFMHRVLNVSQDEDDRSKVKWEEKIWFWKRDWEAEITEQIPDYKIAWKTVSGTSHVGHVTFHELSENMTRVLITIDFNPSGIFEKMASGLRFVKRAAESDLCRFKAFIEAHGEATGAWRGRIEDGEVVDDPGVEEGKPIEETEELRTPGGKASPDDEDGERSEDDGEDVDGPQAASENGSDGRNEEEREAERQERERRREERRASIS